MPPEPTRSIVFLLDGMADFPCPELGGKTPLAAAHKPVLDRLAREGATGRLVTLPDECPAGSEVANLCVLSYDPRTSNPGRGVLEAASMGLDIEPDEIAFRANVIAIEDGRIADHSSGHITSEEAAELIAALNADLERDPPPPSRRLRLFAGVSYRHILLAAGASLEVACTPPHDVLGKPFADHLPRAGSAAGEETARTLCALVRRSQPILERHPVNGRRRAAGKRPGNSLWPWAPGRNPALAPFADRFGLRGAVISAVDLVKGIGRLTGMTSIDVPGATGLPETNYEGKASAAVDALLAGHDFVYVHVEGVDEAGHAGDPALKKKAIEWCDRRLVGHALELLERRGLLGGTRIAVLPDHLTPCSTRTHDRSPVPFVIWGPGIEPDGTTTFTEEACARGRYGLRDGLEFLPLFLGRGVA